MGMQTPFSRAAGAGLLILSVCLPAACRKLPPDGIALVGATLIDGAGGPPLANAVVVVRHGVIESVGVRADFRFRRAPSRSTPPAAGSSRG